MQSPKLWVDQGPATERAAAQAEIENQLSAMLVYILMHSENAASNSIVTLLQTKHKKELEALVDLIDKAMYIHEVTGIFAPLASDSTDLITILFVDLIKRAVACHHLGRYSCRCQYR
jgi:hypothetical protein